ncbi:hypothetical protein M8J77_017326 [Diaphorina citri]|nr:hypothetical protein M8J77_017326 [Diaphorina citri]
MVVDCKAVSTTPPIVDGRRSMSTGTVHTASTTLDSPRRIDVGRRPSTICGHSSTESTVSSQRIIEIEKHSVSLVSGQVKGLSFVAGFSFRETLIFGRTKIGYHNIATAYISHTTFVRSFVTTTS